MDFEVQSGTLGGRFTTIEGLLSQMKENIKQSNPFGVGDSAIQSKLATFLEKISEVGQSHHYSITIVSRKYAPPFATLASVKNAGGLYVGCNNFSRDYALLSIKHDFIVICQWGVEAKRKASPNARRRDPPNASSRLTSFSVGRESRALQRSSWHVHR